MSKIDVEYDLEEALRSKGRVFVLFYASWCPFSQRFPLKHVHHLRCNNCAEYNCGDYRSERKQNLIEKSESKCDKNDTTYKSAEVVCFFSLSMNLHNADYNH
jgi:hypothetical protein